MKNKSQKNSISPTQSKNAKDDHMWLSKDNPNNPFNRGLIPRKIIGATLTEDGKLIFLMDWQNAKESELVLAELAKEKCPSVVFTFYEERIKWTNS